MQGLNYDLHIHSCLSPCADDDMTVNNIVGMAVLNGLRIVALTDHNSCANCSSFFEVAIAAGIVPVAGCELTTAEEIHLLCLFPSLEIAMDFDRVLSAYRMRFPNRPEIFGEQLILNSQDEVTGKEPFLLPPATALSLTEAHGLVSGCGGACLPAHIDRTSNGILAVLGAMPHEPVFPWVEYADYGKREGLEARYPTLRDRSILCNSDAHHLWDIAEGEHSLSFPDSVTDADGIRRLLISMLREEERR